MIRARDLTKTFRRGNDVVHAVRAIDLDVEEGELVAFLGPNGAGKSTTLRMLTSLLRPTSGTALVGGHDVTDDPAGVRSRIGFVGQGNGGGYSYRVRDELHSQGRFYGLSHREYTARADDLVAALDLGGLAKRSVQSLSGGQRRRLDIALGLMNRPALLFLDEPSTGLDPQARANLWNHILTMRERFGMTLALTTHYLDEADTMAERVIIIDRGEIIADATPAALKREHADDVLTIGIGAEAGAGAGTVTEGRPEFAARVRAAIPEGVGEVRVDHGAQGQTIVTVASANGPEHLPRILRSFDEFGLRVDSAEVRRASLDDVFLNLTGRSLREEAA